MPATAPSSQIKKGQKKTKMTRVFKFVVRLLKELGAYATELQALDREGELEED